MNKFVDSSRVDSVQMCTHKYTPASEPVALYDIDFSALMGDFEAEAELSLFCGLKEPAHAVVLWVDFFARGEETVELCRRGPAATRGRRRPGEVGVTAVVAVLYICRIRTALIILAV